MLLWRFWRKKGYQRATVLTENHLVLFFILNAVFSDMTQCCKLSDFIVLCVNGHSAVLIWFKPFRVLLRAVSMQLFNSSGSDDEIFLIEESGVKSALFSSPTQFSEDELSLDFVSAHWNKLLALNKSLYSLKGGIMTLVLPHSTSQALLCSWAHSVVKLDQLVSRDAPCCCVKA